MNDDVIEQLMHDVLDGVATAEEKVRLEQLLASDFSLRERFADLQQMFTALKHVPMEEAPRDMHAQLMHQVEAEAGPARKAGWMETLATAFQARPVPAFAMALVSVTAVGLLLWTGTAQKGVLPDGATLPVTGTMAPVDAPHTATLETGKTRITIFARRNQDAVIVRLAGVAPSGAMLAFSHGAAAINRPAIEGSGAELMAADGHLRLNGEVHAVLRFDIPAAEVGRLNVTLITARGTAQANLSTGSGSTGP